MTVGPDDLASLVPAYRVVEQFTGNVAGMDGFEPDYDPPSVLAGAYRWLAAVADELHSLRRANNQLNDENTRLTRDNERLRDNADELATRVDELKAERDEWAATVGVLKARLDEVGK